MSLELYDKYRDDDGYIDLNKAEKDGLFDPAILRKEPRGSYRGVGLSEENADSALKGWFDFNTLDNEKTDSFLVRTNMLRNDEANYGDYAELIFEEFAKILGIRSPHYDLFKYNGEKGVLSQKLINNKESMIALSDNLSTDYTEGTTLEFVDSLLTQNLSVQGKSECEIEKIKILLRKIVILDVITLNEDRHLGNIGIISNSENQDLSLGIYDNELSFLLGRPINSFATKEDVMFFAESLSDSLMFTENSSSPVDTIKKITADNPELLCFLQKASQINILKVFHNIEERIHAKLPNRVKQIAKLSYEQRIGALKLNDQQKSQALLFELFGVTSPSNHASSSPPKPTSKHRKNEKETTR